jgi:glutamate-5-semialdehyde dehydrogenase
LSTRTWPGPSCRAWEGRSRRRASRSAATRPPPRSSAAGVACEPAGPADYTREFLDLIAAVRVVPSLEEAVATINRDGSAHSDAIVTADPAAADTFMAAVDSAAVFWNASTRFNDGFEFGFGAEIGISTDRLHARGPMGLRELCSYKWLVTGTGQVRG